MTCVSPASRLLRSPRAGGATSESPLSRGPTAHGRRRRAHPRGLTLKDWLFPWGHGQSEGPLLSCGLPECGVPRAGPLTPALAILSGRSCLTQGPHHPDVLILPEPVFPLLPSSPLPISPELQTPKPKSRADLWGPPSSTQARLLVRPAVGLRGTGEEEEEPQMSLTCSVTSSLNRELAQRPSDLAAGPHTCPRQALGR